MNSYSFPPISNQKAKVLILGSMPGVRSLKENQYYAHPGNQFWKLVFAILNEPITNEYSEKKKILLNHNIAIWDVLKYCERSGSSDSNIKNEEINNFKEFFEKHPSIKQIFLNGTKAFDIYSKYVGIKYKIPFTLLTSTSPANTGKNFQTKLDEWEIISKFL